MREPVSIFEDGLVGERERIAIEAKIRAERPRRRQPGNKGERE